MVVPTAGEVLVAMSERERAPAMGVEVRVVGVVVDGGRETRCWSSVQRSRKNWVGWSVGGWVGV